MGNIPKGFKLERIDDHIFCVSEKHHNIRVSKKFYSIDGEDVEDYVFEIFTKPFWFGWFRDKRWEMSTQTNCFSTGLNWSNHLLKQL